MQASAAVPVSAQRAAELFDRLVSRRSPLTARAYRFDLQDFAEFAKAPTPAEALRRLLSSTKLGARHLVERYEAHMIGHSLARATVLRRLAALKSLVREARREEVIDWSLEVESTRNLTPEQKLNMGQRDMSGPTPEEYAKIRAALDADKTLAGRRDRAILGLLRNPALRASEVAALKVRDVDLERRRVWFLGKARVDLENLPIPEGLVEDLREWMSLRGGARSAPLFVQIERFRRERQGARSVIVPGQWLTSRKLSYTAIYQVCVQRGGAGGLKGKKLRPHGLRHLGATEFVNFCAEREIPLVEAQKLLRHKKLETTERYLDRVGRHARTLVEGVG